MRTAETVLGVIRERGRRRLPLENLSRQLYHRDLFLHAYRRLYRNDGARTPGATRETVDGMSRQKIDAIIDALRHKRYRWIPVRRTYIPKKSGKLRPVGLPTWSDKRLQEGVRLILEADDEPQLNPHSHGLRPGRGCHTALGEITKSWRGVKWVMEGEIAQGFDSLDHEVMLSILRESIYDNRFLRLIANLLKAGYLEDWRFNATLSGAPQGGVVSPILRNLYLDRLDQFVEKVLRPAYNRGARRKPYPPYMALVNAARNKRIAGALAEAKTRRRQAQQMPSRAPRDPAFRRLWDVRYADDWRLGLSGPREEAEAITAPLHEYRREILTLTLSEAKTLITNARTQSARFLGYDVVNQHADDQQCRTQHRRCINGAPGLQIPDAIIRATCAQYRRRGKVCHLAARLHDADYRIVTQYQAEYRGFVQYFVLAYNVHRLWRVQRVMQRSLVFTRADKYRTSAGKICRQYKATVKTAHGTLKVLEARHARDDGQEPLVARFGGIALRWPKQAILNDEPKQVYSHRREVVQRLLAQACERCGATENGEVHHIRKLADLSKPGRRAKPLWVRRMAARRRKTLVTCQRCHEAMHRERPSRHYATA
jgi:group II intron reverse transcriptase/maturase